MRLFVLLVLGAALGVAQSKYEGPRPPKPDVPYLLHATTLVETEVAEAKEGTGKDAQVYSVAGVTSSARTPLPEPIFILQSQKLNPDRLQLYRMEAKGGQRLLTMPTGKKAKNAPKPIFMMVHRLGGTLYRIEANEYLENGEYCLSPEGSNQVFCFTAY